MYRKTTTNIRNGEYIEVYKTKKLLPKNTARSPRRNPTTSIQEKINNRRAINKLRLDILENYNAGDIFYTLTYEGKTPTIQEAENKRKNFNRRLRRECKAINPNAVVKYISVTDCKMDCNDEEQSLKYGRIHHHILIRFENVTISPAKVAQIWGHGFIAVRRFKGTPKDAKRLANYFIKKDSNAFFTQNSIIKKRWSASKNLKTPQRKTATIHRKNWRKDPKDIKGYYVDKSSVINGSFMICEGCEYEYQFYRLIRKPQKIPPLTSSWL